MKLMYLAKRKPDFPSQEAFRPRWRQHGALAMSLPGWTRDRRYVHADALPPSAAVPAHEYDGVGVMWFAPDEAAFPATPKAPERVVMNRVTRMASPTPLIAYKGIVEVAARNRADLDSMLAAAAVKADLVVATRECLLWDHGPA